MTLLLSNWSLNIVGTFLRTNALTDTFNKQHGSQFSHAITFPENESTAPDMDYPAPFILLGTDGEFHVYGAKKMWFNQSGTLCIQLKDTDIPSDFAHIRMTNNNWKTT